MSLPEIETCGALTVERYNGMVMETNTDDSTIILRFPRMMYPSEKQIFENIKECVRKEMKSKSS